MSTPLRKRGRQPTPCPDVAKLRELAASDGRLTAIATQMNVSAKAVKRWLAEHSVELKLVEVISFPGEEWRPVAGWEDLYQVSSLGRVRSEKRPGSPGGVLKPCGTTKKVNNYPVVALHRDCKRVDQYVHTLVLEAFKGPRPPGLEACHNDGNPLHNCAGNLRWDTHVANMADQLAHGTRNWSIG